MNPSYLLIAASVAIGVAGQYLLKVGMTHVGRINSLSEALSLRMAGRVITTWQVPVALTMYLVGAFLWMAVLSRENLNFAYPFLGLTYILIMLVGYWFLGENLTIGGVVGTLLVSVGIVLIARS